MRDCGASGKWMEVKRRVALRPRGNFFKMKCIGLVDLFPLGLFFVFLIRPLFSFFHCTHFLDIVVFAISYPI